MATAAAPLRTRHRRRPPGPAGGLRRRAPGGGPVAAARRGGPCETAAAAAARHDHDARTELAAGLAAAPLLALCAPQLVANAASIAAGDLAAVGAVAWRGVACGLVGNALLLAWFAEREERSACAIQAVGVVSNAALLLQVAYAGAAPGAAAAAVAGFGAAACAVAAARPALPAGAWRAWTALTAVVGFAALPQVVADTFLGGAGGAWPGALAATAAVLAQRLPALRGAWTAVSGWCATLLFMLMPVAQLHRNLADPTTLAGLSVGTNLLALCGNGLMIPRALWTRDAVWLTGCAWGTLVMGWGVLLSLAAYGYLARGGFAAVTVALVTYLAGVVVADARARTS